MIWTPARTFAITYKINHDANSSIGLVLMSLPACTCVFFSSSNETLQGRKHLQVMSQETLAISCKLSQGFEKNTSIGGGVIK
jgi:hypothetical protein